MGVAKGWGLKRSFLPPHTRENGRFGWDAPDNLRDIPGAWGCSKSLPRNVVFICRR